MAAIPHPTQADALARIRAKLHDAVLTGSERYFSDMSADGKVQPEGVWTTYSQGCGLLLAEACRERGSPADLVDKMNRSIRYYCKLVDAEGNIQLTTATGVWDDAYTPAWEFSALIWVLRFHQDLLTAETSALMRDALARVARNHAKSLSGPERIHNIPCVSAVALWDAGRLFGESSWQAATRGYLQRLVAACNPDGWWKEHTGPTTVYNAVYVHALGVHLWDGGDTDVADVLRRAGAFHSRFVYPDGSPVSIIDGRVLWHGGSLSPLGLTGLVHTETGSGYVRTLAASPHPFALPVSNNTLFTPQAYRMLHSGVRVSVMGGAPSVPLAKHVAIHPAGKFTVVVSGLLGSVENRWGYDRLQHIELHHRDLGVLVGGGHSRGAEMAFITSAEGHLATGSRLEDSGRRLRLAYPWGEAVITVEPRPDHVSVVMEADAGTTDLTVCLPVLPGWLEQGHAHATGDKLTELVGRGAAIRVEPEAVLRYPLKPWFPYHPQGEAPESIWRYGLCWRGRGRLKVRLTAE